jgi:hypothetical protein
MAVEPEYDGIYTLDEHAANILRMHYASGVKEVMAFTGFAANASQKSYVLAGSFSRFLLATYGAKRFDRVYSSLAFEKEYGKSLDVLEAEWKAWLAPLLQPLTIEDSLHFQYYYDRASILFNPCLRRLGKLQRRAAEAYEQKRYNDAEHLYADALAEGGGLAALIGQSYALLHQHHLQTVIEMLDTTRLRSGSKQRAALYLEKGDLQALAGATGMAQSYYDSARMVKLSASSFLSAYGRSVLDTSDVAAQFRQYLYLLYEQDNSDKQRLRVIDSMIALHRSGLGFDRVGLILHDLRNAFLQGSGKLVADTQISTLPPALLVKDSGLSFDDSLAISIILVRNPKDADFDQILKTTPHQYVRAVSEVLDEIKNEQSWQNSIH